MRKQVFTPLAAVAATVSARVVATAAIAGLIAFIPAPARAEDCTVAVVSGSVTADGRPLLWKNRDITAPNQEVRYSNDGAHGGYIAIVSTGGGETSAAYVGVNDEGFAVMNSDARDLQTHSSQNDGPFMKLALRVCGSVADFESLLVATSGRRGHIWSNFGVIDRLGGAAIFEADDWEYRRYDAESGGGYLVRTNFSVWGGGPVDSRYPRANGLITGAIAARHLDHRFLIQDVSKDIGGPPSLPCGEWSTDDPALSRWKTRAAAVVHGVRPTEDPRLTTFWCTLGESSCGVSVPLWSYGGTPPPEMSTPGAPAPMCAEAQRKELYCYTNLTTDTTINTNALVGDDGQTGIQGYSLPIERECLARTRDQLAAWRLRFPSVSEVAGFQAQRVQRALLLFSSETAPGEVVGPDTAGIECLSGVNPCVEVPFKIRRWGARAIRGYSVTFRLSSELALCAPPAVSVREGDYLNSIGATTFYPVERGAGRYTVDCAILGAPCGATAPEGVLFTVEVTNTGSSGTGILTVETVRLRDCANHPIESQDGPAAELTIDTLPPLAVADLLARQVKTGNPPGDSTAIALTFTPADDATRIHICRKGFGDYPEYDDGAGAVPASPATLSQALAEGWGPVPIATSGAQDAPPHRDFWYYVLFSEDACGNLSSVSNMTGGTLNYHLGDVSDGMILGQGDNVVATADISMLGARYYHPLTYGDPANPLDIGPTTDFSTDARPTTDDLIDFEDLMVFALNFSVVGATRPPDATIATGERPSESPLLQLVLDDPAPGAREITAHLRLSRHDCAVKGLHARVTWPAAALALREVLPGELVDAQADDVFFMSLEDPAGEDPHAAASAADGCAGVLIDAAVLGTDLTFSGSGDVALLSFAVREVGARPVLLAGELRDRRNSSLDAHGESADLPRSSAVAESTSSGWQLLGAEPNPAGCSADILFRLGESCDVRLRIYHVDGRLVRALLDQRMPPGAHRATWDRRTDSGQPAGAGVYFYRLEAGSWRPARKIIVLP